MRLLTRAELRERARQKLGIVTPIEQGYENALPGDMPTDRPFPTNYFLNNALEERIAEVNTTCQFSGSNGFIPYNVAASTSTGMISLDFSSAIQGYTQEYQVQTIQHVTWVPTGGTNSTQVVPTTYEEMDRNTPDWQNVSAGTPTKYTLSNYNLVLFPPPSTAGTIYFTGTLSMMAPIYDPDYIQQVNVEHQLVFIVGMALSYAESCPSDLEMARLADMLRKDYQQKLNNLLKWIQSQMSEFQGDITPRTNRRAYRRAR